MYTPHLILTILLLQVLTASSLAIDVPAPDSLFQDQNLTPNTTLPLRLTQPQNLTDRYLVACERVTDPPLPSLNPSSCLDAATVICDHLILYVARNRWRWVDEPGCSLGYFIPSSVAPERVPSHDECSNEIYGLIIERCAFNSRYNVGSINVAQLPTFDDPGLPMTEGYPRYLMAPARL